MDANCASEAGLAKFKPPEAFQVLDAFPVPMSANGVKIQRGSLGEMADKEMGGS